MEEAQYRKLQESIQYCRDAAALERLVQGILAPTGFGSNSLTDTEDPIGLDYREMAECLAETDRKFFQYEIELLLSAYSQQHLIGAGAAIPEKPAPFNPWEQFM